MRKKIKGRKFNRKRDQRKAFLLSLIRNFVLTEKMRTTEARAKEIQGKTEKYITRAKQENLANRRYFLALFSPRVVNKLFVFGKKYQDRPGGYTRITKLPARTSDGARMAMIEFV
jgi:large subunit ribosomal protein L17